MVDLILVRFEGTAMEFRAFEDCLEKYAAQANGLVYKYGYRYYEMFRYLCLPITSHLLRESGARHPQ
jgi:hypothetical protein